MTHKFNIDRRRLKRLRGYDYSQAGAYFVTICTKKRECLFGEIVDRKMILNEAGRMVERWYRELPNKFNEIRCDTFVCMPNHIHFVVINVGVDSAPQGRRVGADLCVRPEGPDEGVTPGGYSKQGEHIGSPLQAVVQWFKTMTTNGYIRGVKQKGWQPFAEKLWQRNYYEHVVRNEKKLDGIRQYIANNPIKWEFDRENPSRHSDSDPYM